MTLNKNYTFDNFFAKEDNIILQAAKFISKNQGTKYNPITFQGEYGTGKTHLVQAIGNELNNTGLVIYNTPYEFTNEFIGSIANNCREDYINKYRNENLNALIIDDIQFFRHSPAEELMYTCDSLYNKNVQVIFTSDRPISKIKTFSKRLISRLNSGLVINIPTYDLEEKYIILRNILHKKGISIDENIMDDIVNNTNNDIRLMISKILSIEFFENLSENI